MYLISGPVYEILAGKQVILPYPRCCRDSDRDLVLFAVPLPS